MRPLEAEGDKKLKKIPMVDDSRGKLDGVDWREQYEKFGEPNVEGLMPVMSAGKWGIVDKHGNEVVSPKYEFIDKPSSQGFAVMKFVDRYGLVNVKNGVEVVPPEYSRVWSPDNNGVLSAELPAGSGEQYHYYNMQGERVTWDGQPLEIGGVSKAVEAKAGKALEPVVVSKKPNVPAWHSRFDKVGQLWWKRHVVQKGGKFGFVSENGLSVTQPKYDDVKNPHYEFPWVKVGKKWGIVNKFGKEIVPPKYDLVGNVWEGLACVQNSGRWGYVNIEGVEIVPPRYDEVTDFDKGFAKVRLGKKWRRINIRGEFVYADGAVYESQTFEDVPDVKNDTSISSLLLGLKSVE